MYIIAKHALAWQELIKLGNGNWGRCLLGKDRTFKDGILLHFSFLFFQVRPNWNQSYKTGQI